MALVQHRTERRPDTPCGFAMQKFDISSVAVVTFFFRNNWVKSLADCNLLYSKEYGKFYGGIVSGFASYRISKCNISFSNFFVDNKESAEQK